MPNNAERTPTKIILVRHGESWANHYGVIISKPENGIKVAGLTPKGVDQVRRATRIALRDGTVVPEETVVYSSTLRRCRETAGIVTQELGLSGYSVRDELNERNFGDLEFGDHSKYALVYEADKQNPDHHEFGGESVNQVRERVVRLLEDIEQQHEGKTVVLVTHKDISEVLQTVLEGLPPQLHRDRTLIPKHENGDFVELRRDRRIALSA